MSNKSNKQAKKARNESKSKSKSTEQEHRARAQSKSRSRVKKAKELKTFVDQTSAHLYVFSIYFDCAGTFTERFVKWKVITEVVESL